MIRIETIRVWIFVGFGLLLVGTWLVLFGVAEDGKFLAVIGLVYFGISVMLTLVHDRHMMKRTRARRE